MFDKIFDSGGYYKFRGIDGSLGYRTGKVYRLYISSAYFKGGLIAERKGWSRVLWGPGYCPYDNIDLFFKDWSIVKKD